MLISSLICMLAATALIMVSLSLLTLAFLIRDRRTVLVSLITFVIDFILFHSVYDAFVVAGAKNPLGRLIVEMGPRWIMILFVVLFGISILRSVAFHQVRRTSLSPFSSEEAMNQIPIGILFSTEDGQIFQTNQLMEDLHYELTGKVLHNARDFWENADFISGKIDSPELPRIFMTSDGRKWLFTRNLLETPFRGIYEILAIDVTKEEELRKDENEALDRLKSMNQRLHEYNHVVDDTIRKEELLAAKMRVHDNMGSDLLTVRMFLTNDDAPVSAETVLSQWKKNLRLLDEEAQEESGPDQIERFVAAAKHLGIDLQLIGTLPEKFEIVDLISVGIQECMTNAIQHAEATQMYVVISETDSEYQVSYSNNGKPLSGPVKEGGGLTIFRRKAEQCGATLEYAKSVHFNMILHIPK